MLGVKSRGQENRPLVPEIYVKYIDGIPTYGYCTPKPGGPHWGTGVDKISPSGTTIVAYTHTHPNDNEFSPGDISTANDSSINAYVVGPNLLLQKYCWETGGIIPLYNICPTPLTSMQKSALVAQFQDSWNRHINFLHGTDENFCHCDEKIWPAG